MNRALLEVAHPGEPTDAAAFAEHAGRGRAVVFPVMTAELVLADTIGTEVDVLVVGLVGGDDGPELHGVGATLADTAARSLREQLIAVGASDKAEATTRVPAPAGLGVRSVLAVGLGDPEKIDAEQIRKSAGAAARALAGAATVATTLSLIDLEAAAQGSYLGSYTFTEFRSEKSAPKPGELPPGRIELLVSTITPEIEAALAHSVTIAEAVAAARTFVNTPPSHLYPAELATRAVALAEAAGMTTELLDETALAAAGYGGILGVGKGSSRPPRLVRLSYVSGKPGAKKVALVGKGVTFDTGGISIKPAAGMELMTSDMGGAAAVIAAAAAAAGLGLAVDVTATVPIAENMPSGTAQRPGDVLTQYGGITVEVLNTDAEGRLILADAIVRACEDHPDYLIDVATLTGAQVVALGARTPGVMGTDEFRDRVAEISRGVGENGWAMPLPGELRADLDSTVADIANVTSHRNGGMLTAAIFLREFVCEDVGWAHLDIAGPAYNSGAAYGYIGKGGTGVPVRTLVAVLEDIAARG
jgi:leucyl aminopeptidase